MKKVINDLLGGIYRYEKIDNEYENDMNKIIENSEKGDKI